MAAFCCSCCLRCASASACCLALIEALTSDAAFCNWDLALFTSDCAGVDCPATLLALLIAFCNAVRVLSSATWPAELFSTFCALLIVAFRSAFNALASLASLLLFAASKAS